MIPPPEVKVTPTDFGIRQLACTKLNETIAVSFAIPDHKYNQKKSSRNHLTNGVVYVKMNGRLSGAGKSYVYEIELAVYQVEE